jgi:hypothetical protein
MSVESRRAHHIPEEDWVGVLFLVLQRYRLLRTWHGRLARVAWYSTQFDPYPDGIQQERSDFFDMTQPVAAMLMFSFFSRQEDFLRGIDRAKTAKKRRAPREFLALLASWRKCIWLRLSAAGRAALLLMSVEYDRPA